MDKTGASDDLWLYALMYVVYIHNRLARETLGWRTPIEKAFGGIRFNTGEVAGLKNVGELADLVIKRTGG